MDIETRILQLIDAKWAVEDIAADVQASTSYVYGVLTVHRPGRKRIRRSNKTSMRSEIERLFEEGNTADQIAEAVGCSRAYAYRFAEKRAIKDPHVHHKVAGLLGSGYTIERTAFLSQVSRCYVRKVAKELNRQRIQRRRSELRPKIIGLLQAGLVPVRIASLCEVKVQYVYRIRSETKVVS